MYGSVRGVPGNRHSYRDRPFNGQSRVLVNDLKFCVDRTSKYGYSASTLCTQWEKAYGNDRGQTTQR